jgi:hypothetical protein
MSYRAKTSHLTLKVQFQRSFFQLEFGLRKNTANQSLRTVLMLVTATKYLFELHPFVD